MSSAHLTRSTAAALAVAGVAACSIQERTDPRPGAANGSPDSASSDFIRLGGEAEPPRGVRSGDLIWIWGMPGTVPGTAPPRLVDGGAGPEARQAVANIGEVLAMAGADPRDVAQCSVFVADSADIAAASVAYADFFGAAPERTAVVADGLALDARVEIECTVVLSGGP